MNNQKGLSIPCSLVEFILLGPLDDRRQLQDSPILGDVWVDFGTQPCERLDLLIAPYRGQHAGDVAYKIGEGLGFFPDKEDDQDQIVAKRLAETNLASLQGLVVANLTFREVMQVVVPKTGWWLDKRIDNDDEDDGAEVGVTEPGEGSIGQEAKEQAGSQAEVSPPRKHQIMNLTPEKQLELLQDVLDSADTWHTKPRDRQVEREIQRLQELPSLHRFWALTGLILWAGEQSPLSEVPSADPISDILKERQLAAEEISKLLDGLRDEMLESTIGRSDAQDSEPEALVYQVSRNRSPMPALSRSIPAVKADAATYLFKVNCSQIGWAVIDSGIDGAHPAFRDEQGKSRVKRSFDFKNLRKIVSLGNLKKAIRDQNIQLLKDDTSLLRPLVTGDGEEDTKRLDEAHKDLRRLAEDARRQGPVHWELVQKYMEIKPHTKPPTAHGTHVAGIIGANKNAAQTAADVIAEEKAARAAAKKAANSAAETPLGQAAAATTEKPAVKVTCKENPNFANGMCPDIQLYDFRVLGPSIKDAEFAIIAALQFIRFLNDRDNFLTIHGANLSLSIPHDVRNFACGRTPICEECERLVSNGVVVVAAAGNHGYQSFETKDGSYNSYAAFSITDPGNAANVLTVGATHRFWPHTYGISFFSSRGPTGDGRLKPDLVAPGERIRAPISDPKDEWGDLDGTSMAAPHVSGAAAMLMARYSELVGQPLRIKSILCESATDLGRERSFQGHGMLDVLRAFQSI